ncbi:MAG: helix-turn-helix transcriptional regulator, partial [Bacteroidales bacterium]|nr:helix-turn-helix transcriptional regulator [Bacteroidales bacterium]
MKININIVIAETSDLLYEGLSTILYQSEYACFVYRIFSYEEIETTLINKNIDVLLINPILTFSNGKGIKNLKKNYPFLLIGCINMNMLDNNTVLLYDFILNVYDSSTQMLSVIKKQLDLKQVNNADDDEDEALSERETEVLLQIIKGHTNKQIADILYISVHTVISHRRNIMIKTGIRSQAGLALYAVSKSLIS